MTALARRRRISTGNVVLDVVLVVVGLVMITPLVWLVVQSFTDGREAFRLPPSWLPTPFSVQNFADVFPLIPFGRMFLNSLIVSCAVTAGSLITSLLAAYAFSRLRFRGRTGLFVGMLSALMVPVQLTIIPVFILMRTLHLVDTLAALILPGLINVFAIFFLRQYFNSIPLELDEAARIDGAGHLRILVRILIPLSGPAISALVILTFQAAWNDYFGPLIFISSQQNMTLPLGLVTLQSGQGGGATVVVFAAVTMVVAPVLVLFLVFQRAFIASIASSGIRG